jgi:two-component system sensor histidine kinase KdpD
MNLSITGFVYLLVVVLQSLLGNFTSSAAVSVLAVLCLDFFFTAPLFSFEVTNPLDVLALISFLTTGLVIPDSLPRCAKKQRDRTTSGVRWVGGTNWRNGYCPWMLKRRCSRGRSNCFRMFLTCGLSACLMRPEVEIHCAGNSLDGLADEIPAAYSAGRDCENVNSGTLIRCLRAAGKTIGAIGFEGLREPELMAGHLSALAAAMLERAHTFRNASHAAAAAQAELFRGAILDALAHEFKTPLATIVTAAGGLREVGPLRPEQLELADTVEEEAARLGSLASRLLRAARLDREEVRPDLELTDMADLVATLADHYSRQWSDRKVSVRKEAAATRAMADPELLQLALRQLLDNACKYSVPGSAVTASIDSQADWVAIRTSNSGSFIRQSERSRIFERFYWGAEARHINIFISK